VLDMRVRKEHTLDGGWIAILRRQVRQHACNAVVGLSERVSIEQHES
jgi:hypothetical protein